MSPVEFRIVILEELVDVRFPYQGSPLNFYTGEPLRLDHFRHRLDRDAEDPCCECTRNQWVGLGVRKDTLIACVFEILRNEKPQFFAKYVDDDVLYVSQLALRERRHVASMEMWLTPTKLLKAIA